MRSLFCDDIFFLIQIISCNLGGNNNLKFIHTQIIIKMSELQDGIYYKEGQRPGNSYCALFFDVKGNLDAKAIGNELSEFGKPITI